jgi:hypothetical protein
MGEPDAYRWLRTRAMSSARRIPDTAQEVVARETIQPPAVDPVGTPTTIQGSNTASAAAQERGAT